MSIIEIQNLSKRYHGGFQALKNVNLKIERAEILALLGPNGAGKTTLISIICGIVNASDGTVVVDGYDIVEQYRETRSLIGLVPQELTTDAFESVWDTVSFSRGLFGKQSNPQIIEQILKDLSLWEKKDNKIMELSGGMKRRVLIAKALSHEPKILFLDEPTAGVDVELRKDMWNLVEKLRKSGVTIILTTHYIEEAEEIADRIGVINHGELLLVEDKTELMRKLGKKQLELELKSPISHSPLCTESFNIEVVDSGNKLVYTFDANSDKNGIPELIQALSAEGIQIKDLNTEQSSLEDIFVSLVHKDSPLAIGE